MNRYTTGGIARDLIDGWRVGIVAPRLERAREQFLAVLDELPEELLGRTLTATGRERLELATGGRLSVHSKTPGALRGYSLDVVVILDHEHMNRVVIEDEARAALMPRKGELILA